MSLEQVVSFLVLLHSVFGGRHEDFLSGGWTSLGAVNRLCTSELVCGDGVPVGVPTCDESNNGKTVQDRIDHNNCVAQGCEGGSQFALDTYHCAYVAPTQSPTFAEECDDIYGGHWTLVRHSYAQWFQSTDSLQGTDEYGVYDNDPQSLQSWSIPFADQLESDGSTRFMFSNGDCSEWMVTTNDQFLSTSSSAISATILASHVSDTSYNADWLVRGPSNPEDPWISYGNHGDNDFATNMYSENAPVNTVCAIAAPHRCQRWENDADKSLNVWIQTGGDRDCTAFAIDDWLLECSDEWAAHGTYSGATEDRITALEAAVSTAQTEITANSDAITDLEGSVSTAQSDIIALNERMDEFGVFGAKAAGVNVDGWQDTGLFFGLMYKDLIIISLVCMNVVMMIAFSSYLGCCFKVHTPKSYAGALDASDADL